MQEYEAGDDDISSDAELSDGSETMSSKSCKYKFYSRHRKVSLKHLRALEKFQTNLINMCIVQQPQLIPSPLCN